MLHKRYRINSPKDFNLIYKKGRKFRGEFGMLIALPSNDIKTNKIGLIVGKKVGNAVQRNLLTRRLRFLAGKDIILNDDILQIGTHKFSYIAYKQPETFESLERDWNKQISDFIKSS